MTRLKAIEDSFLHWSDNYGLVCRKALVTIDISVDTDPLCQAQEDDDVNCMVCPLSKYYPAGCVHQWMAVDNGLVANKQPKKATEVMTLCLLLVYYAEGGRKEWK